VERSGKILVYVRGAHAKFGRTASLERGRGDKQKHGQQLPLVEEKEKEASSYHVDNVVQQEDEDHLFQIPRRNTGYYSQLRKSTGRAGQSTRSSVACAPTGVQKVERFPASLQDD
jgi:hypothetical protein